MITQTYTLSLQPGGAPLRVPCVQRDANSRDISFELTSGGVAFSPPNGAVVTIDGTKPDGKSFSTAGAISGTKITVTLTQQMTAVAGDVPCQLTIASGTAVLGTARFILAVSEAAIPTAPDLSTSDMSVFETLKNSAAQSASAAAASAAQAAAAANRQVGTTNIADSAVTNVKIANGAVSTGKLSSGAVTPEKISDSFAIAWTPTVSGAGSYTSQVGAYVKLGKLIILHFYVYGTFAGNASDKIVISGCPVAPTSTAAGGGMISGYTSAANVIPTGWRIDREGAIHPVGQSTGTDGAKYSSDAIFQKTDGEFSAAGTIAFVVA